MQFDWDDDKNARNIARHGIDFADAIAVFDGPVVTHRDARHDYGEERYRSVGFMGGILVAVVWTPRVGRWIISARVATANERQAYFRRFPRRR